MNIEHCYSSFMGSRKHGRRNEKTMRKIARRWLRKLRGPSVQRSCHGPYVSNGVHPSDGTGILPVTPSRNPATGCNGQDARTIGRMDAIRNIRTMAGSLDAGTAKLSQPASRNLAHGLFVSASVLS